MPITIAACQPRRVAKIDIDMKKTLDMIEEAAQCYDADIACFPERFPITPKWGKREPYIETIRKACEKHEIDAIIGAHTNYGNKKRNSAIYIGRSGIITHDKTTLFASERTENISEESNPIIKVNNYDIGIGVCYDMHFPEYARLLTLKGADVIIFISGIVPKYLENMWKGIAATRCYENHIPVISVSEIYEKYIGQSIIVTPPYNVLAECDADEEGVIAAEIEPERFKGKHFGNSPDRKGSELIDAGEVGPYLKDFDRNLESERRKLMDSL